MAFLTIPKIILVEIMDVNIKIRNKPTYQLIA